MYGFLNIFLPFSFPLSDLHIPGRALLYVSLVNFLYYYCLCVNQLYKKKGKKGVNRLFVLPSEHAAERTSEKR